MKRIVLFSFACLLVGAPLIADSQVDIGVNIPTVIGISIDGDEVSEEMPFTLPIPDLMYNYFFDVGKFKLGGGFRVWSVIVATAAYPIVSAELEFDRFLFNAHVGGLLFPYTSIGGSGFETGNVWFPEASAAFRFTDWFALGVSVLGIYVPDEVDDGFGYSFNVLARFRVK